MTRVVLIGILLLLLSGLPWLGPGGFAEACPFCAPGFGAADSFSQPMEELNTAYEKDGRNALPYIREVMRTSIDPMLVKRAAEYILELEDRDSLPLLEDMVSVVTKRVAFGNFGYGTYEFYCRLVISHTLVKLGSGKEMADKIWKKYDALSLVRKSEIPFLLKALEDPQMEERLLNILDKKEQQQLMEIVLYVLRLEGSANALPGLRSRVEEWARMESRGTESTETNAPTIYYSTLIIHAEMAIAAIEGRNSLLELIHPQ